MGLRKRESDREDVGGDLWMECKMQLKIKKRKKSAVSLSNKERKLQKTKVFVIFNGLLF